jgi:hypothetical protein
LALFFAILLTEGFLFAKQTSEKKLPAEEPDAVVSGKGREIEGTVQIAEPVIHEGGFWMRGKPTSLVYWLNGRTPFQTVILDKKIPLEKEEIFKEPFLLFYGTEWPKLKEKEIANLKRYLLEKEGFLWVDIIMLEGEESEKAIESTKQFFKRILPKSRVELIKKEHDIYHNLFNIEVPPPGPSGVEKKELEGIFLSERLVVLLTDLDYSHAFCLDTPFLPRVLRFSTNVILYALTHGKISDYSQYKP